MTENNDDSKLFSILVYGSERLGYEAPPSPITTDNITISFAPFDTELKLQNYDGVIMFQGIWARWKQIDSWYGERDNYLTDLQNDMLRTRIKQIQELEKKGGFVCILMGRLDYNDFDLAKDVLKWYGIHSNACGDRTFFRKVYFNEMSNYFSSDYGVAKTYFSYYGDGDYRVIADTASFEGDVAICLDSQYFLIPCHVIKKDAKAVEELVKTLTPGLVGTFRKLNQELPAWVGKFNFTKEAESKKVQSELEEQLSEVNKEIASYEDFKKPLVQTGTLLVESVLNLLKNGIGIDVSGEDNGIEDIQLFQKDGEERKVVSVIEVKGVNSNVTRDAINQVDAHKERNGFDKSFPGLLIVNTFIKSSSSIEQKDKPIEKEQIDHAIVMKVLIMRTLDVLRAYDLVHTGKIKVEDLINILLAENGWLEINNGGQIDLHNK